jgi:hypothetical protein
MVRAPQKLPGPDVDSGSGAALLPTPDKTDVAAAAPVAQSDRIIREADTKTLAAATGEGFDGLARFVSSSLKPSANHTIMVVSAGPKNRAPYSAFNLAAEAARLGRRVLLVDRAAHDPLLTAMLLPEHSTSEPATQGYHAVESVPYLHFSPADHLKASEALRDAVDEKGEAFDLIVIDGGVAAKSRIHASLRRDLDDVFLMQHEDDTGSIVIALVTLEESGMENIKVVRMTRSGLQY